MGVEKDTKQGDLSFEALIKEAPYLPGDNYSVEQSLTASDIPWVNFDLIKEGQDFVRRNLFSIMVSNSIGLLMGLAIKPITAVLLRTGMSYSQENSQRRYLSTGIHIHTWYEADFQDIISDVQKVRRLHFNACKAFTAKSPRDLDLFLPISKRSRKIINAIQADLAEVPVNPAFDTLLTYDPYIPISQFTMVLIQFGFMGLVVLFPEAFGINDRRGLEGFCHFWAVLGKLLGIEDRFNLGLHTDQYAMLRIFNEIMLPSINTLDERGMFIWDSIFTIVSKYSSPINLNPLLIFIVRELVGVQDSRRGVSLFDRCLYQIIRIVSYMFTSV